MPNHFDFHSYNTPPIGWRLLEASKECLRLWRDKEKRTYIVTSPSPGRFECHFTSDIQRTPQFVFGTDSFYRTLQLLGCLHKTPSV